MIISPSAVSLQELCLIRFHPATEEEEVAYISLYSYFSSRGRFGVVANNNRHVKDLYLIPLSAKDPVPPKLLPFEGPGKHCLLWEVIRHVQSPHTLSPRHTVPLSCDVVDLPLPPKWVFPGAGVRGANQALSGLGARPLHHRRGPASTPLV